MTSPNHKKLTKTVINEMQVRNQYSLAVMVHWIKNYIRFLFVAFSQIPLYFLFQQLLSEIQKFQQYLGSSSA